MEDITFHCEVLNVAGKALARIHARGYISSATVFQMLAKEHASAVREIRGLQRQAEAIRQQGGPFESVAVSQVAGTVASWHERRYAELLQLR